MASDFSFLTTQPAVKTSQANAWPAYAAALCAVGAVVLASLRSDNLTLSSTGYVLGSIVVPALVVAYRFTRRSAAQDPFYVPRLGIERMALAVLVVGIIAGGTNAWFVATELAKQ